MKIVLYTNVVSSHQLPLARELIQIVGESNFLYVYESESSGENQEVKVCESWIVQSMYSMDVLETCDLLVVGGLRPVELMERRLKNGLAVYYMSERWFKPIDFCRGQVLIAGWIRLLIPRYQKMAHRFVSMFRATGFRYLPIGPWAKKDMVLLCRIFGLPQVESEKKIVDWGYFVSPSTEKRLTFRTSEGNSPLRVLWIGRMLRLKCVDTIIKAISFLDKNEFVLHLVGDGPDKARLVKMAQGLSNVFFSDPVDLATVRSVMHDNDVLVFSSNAQEGWGAVVSEALEEGMCVIGSNEAGACAAMLPPECRFNCGDWRRLMKLLELARSGELMHPNIGSWTAVNAARRITELSGSFGLG